MLPAITQTQEDDSQVTENLQRLQHEPSDPGLKARATNNAREAMDCNLANLRQTRSALQSSPALSKTQSQRVLSKLEAQLLKANGDLKKVGKEKDKEIDSLKQKIKEKDAIIEKFELFIDICNQKVMF